MKQDEIARYSKRSITLNYDCPMREPPKLIAFASGNPGRQVMSYDMLRIVMIGCAKL